jgi:hypothetical protein
MVKFWRKFSKILRGPLNQLLGLIFTNAKIVIKPNYREPILFSDLAFISSKT